MNTCYFHEPELNELSKRFYRHFVLPAITPGFTLNLDTQPSSQRTKYPVQSHFPVEIKSVFYMPELITLEGGRSYEDYRN